MNLDWCAGFFDGEGTVGCWRNGGNYRRLSASVAQNVRYPLDIFAAITGLGKVHGPYKSTNGREHWKLEFNAKETLELYTLFENKLLVKEEQYHNAIEQFRHYEATVTRSKSTTRGIS